METGNMAAGSYMAKLQTGDRAQTGKIVIVR
jgi:hypothetical protein